MLVALARTWYVYASFNMALSLIVLSTLLFLDSPGPLNFWLGEWPMWTDVSFAFSNLLLLYFFPYFLAGVSILKVALSQRR